MSEPIRETIRTLHPETRRKVWAGIDALRADPFQGRPLRDEFTGFWRLAVGQLRIVYRVTPFGLELADVGRRATIYEDLARKLRLGDLKDRRATYGRPSVAVARVRRLRGRPGVP